MPNTGETALGDVRDLLEEFRFYGAVNFILLLPGNVDSLRDRRKQLGKREK